MNHKLQDQQIENDGQNSQKSAIKESSVSFEDAFHRLEKIVEQMNGTTISLDQSLSLYEEADKLIQGCFQKLAQAETRVQVLIKNRDGSLALNADQKPTTEDLKF